MKHLKKLVPILIGLIMVTQFAPVEPVTADQTTDTFAITVTGEFLWIDITNATWVLGTVAMSSVHFTNLSKTFIADMDNCSVNADLKLQITSDGADWTACADGETAGSDIYRLNASIDIWVADNNTIVTASATTISSNIGTGNNETFDLRFDAPTSTSTSAQQSITVTATVVKS